MRYSRRGLFLSCLFPPLGVVAALLLLLRSKVWQHVALTMGVLVSICGLRCTCKLAAQVLGMVDAAVSRVPDAGGFLSLLGYGTVLLGLVLVARSHGYLSD
jgi:hypothetical protein